MPQIDVDSIANSETPHQTSPLGAFRSGPTLFVWTHLSGHHEHYVLDNQLEILLRDNVIRVVRKPAFCICENKDADQLRGNREADQHLCFRYIDSTIPLLPIYKISSL